jgi:hypothetical protein
MAFSLNIVSVMGKPRLLNEKSFLVEFYRNLLPGITSPISTQALRVKI